LKKIRVLSPIVLPFWETEPSQSVWSSATRGNVVVSCLRVSRYVHLIPLRLIRHRISDPRTNGRREGRRDASPVYPGSNPRIHLNRLRPALLLPSSQKTNYGVGLGRRDISWMQHTAHKEQSPGGTVPPSEGQLPQGEGGEGVKGDMLVVTSQEHTHLVYNHFFCFFISFCVSPELVLHYRSQSWRLIQNVYPF